MLPNATETRIVVTGNYRAWRHFIAMRASEHADVEIRELAIECLRQLQQRSPNVFDDFEISTLDDGTEVASSPFVTEGLAASWLIGGGTGGAGAVGSASMTLATDERAAICDEFRAGRARTGRPCARAGTPATCSPTCWSANGSPGWRRA